MNVFEMQLKNYQLATAEIIYRLPDHPELLQSFIWQHYDIAPEYPELHRFLAFWEENIEGRLHSVKVARQELVNPSEARFADAYFRLH
jgi:uncharacterized protein Usg